MPRTINTRVAVLAAVAVVFAAALVFVSASTGDAAVEEPVIDTAAPITSDQCAPCHLDLGSVDQPGLIFNHGNHLLVSCDGCHQRMPHRDGATETVPMEVCFACHGIQHGNQGELASGECEDCHTKSFTLRPPTHTEDWAARPHALATMASGVNDCMMCHDAPEDCDACHREQDVDVDEIPNLYHTVVIPKDKGASVKVYPDRPVSMSQCAYCHPDLDAITPGRIVFAHAAHLERNYSCVTCHNEFAHDELGTNKPDMQSCYRCHGTYHNGAGLVAEGEDCLKCHPKSFELMPSDHTEKFIAKGHAKPASEDPSYCSMCHPSEFCIECHTGKSDSPAAPAEPVVPESHTEAKWLTEHGPLYLDAKGACGACHDGPSCQTCHKTVVPHPAGWIKDHTPPAGVTAQDCNICHADRSQCQECHHGNLRAAELIKKNCTPCHDEMKQEPATGIRNKGLAEHAVHFNVAETKGKPYRCPECHVGFDSGSPTMNSTNPHDLRLCYECHGALDLQNIQIAPYPGSELCLRCHTDLNI